MAGLPLPLARASVDDSDVVINLIDDAIAWLRGKDTDQWQRPWGGEGGRNRRILCGLHGGKTWIAWDGPTAVATFTADADDHGVWPEQQRKDPAVYVSRLVVSRSYAGQGIGAQLLDWAGLYGRRERGANWVRVDVWTTNTALHRYYLAHGFERYGTCLSIPGYPSAALFQKPVDHIVPAHITALQQVPSAH